MKDWIRLMYNKTPLWIYIVIITIIAAILAFTSSAGDSLTVDESPHIGAAYSYIVTGDYRLNPEHPPLLKLFSGASIWLGTSLEGNRAQFPINSTHWVDKVNAQWDIGYEFLFRTSNNDANTIIWWARFPTIVIFLLGGVYLAYSVHYHTQRKSISLIALFLYSFSPSVIAHGRLVTTDMIAAVSFIICIDIWIRYVQKPHWQYIVYLILAVSFAFLSKFSTILLLPVFFISGLGYIVIMYWKSTGMIKHGIRLFRDALIVGLGVFFCINVVYYISMRNMSVDTQVQLIEESFPQDNEISSITKQTLSTLVRTPGMQYFGQYVLGQAMVIQRVGGGNTTFLLGSFTNQSFKSYFPITYILKEQLTTILLLVSLITVSILLGVKAAQSQSLSIKRKWILQYWYEWTIFITIGIYWAVSINGNLNLGIRHILPAVILTYILIAIGVVRLLLPLHFSRYILVVLFFVYGCTTIFAHPSYISYLNMLAGQNQGYQIFTDSNIDWGQDLKRLYTWTKEQNIDTLYIDYFGTGDIQYYLPDVQLIPIKSSDGPKIGYTAISTTMFQDSFYLKQKDETYQEYWWLKWKKPDYIIGNSILIYKNTSY